VSVVIAIPGRNGKDAAAELEALQEQQKDAADAADKQPAGSADQRKQKKRARKQAEAEAAAAAERQRQLEEEVSEAQWRRASALRRSRPALLAEMAVWEREAEEKEAAAEAGIVSDTTSVHQGFCTMCCAACARAVCRN
jgi:chromosome segregation ATPase